MADEKLLGMLKRDVSEFNIWRVKNPHGKVDLGAADLQGARLNGALLEGAYLHGALLDGAHLVNANLCDADLGAAFLHRANVSHANLSGCNLELADLRGADLRHSEFNGAKLSKACLQGANLGWARLEGAMLDSCQIGWTQFSPEGVEPDSLLNIDHVGPSQVSFEVLLGHELPDVFLRRCGVPEELIIQLPYIRGSMGPISFYSCFISYSHAQSDFAERLHNDLQAKGVRVWLDKHELVPGDKVLDKIHEGIKFYDKLILCCSAESLSSSWCHDEVEKAFRKERDLWKEREHREDIEERKKRPLALVPITLDDNVFGWDDPKASKILERFVVDFRNWKDPGEYKKSFEALMRALRDDDGGRRPPPTPKL